jgi:hypothetical protein
MASGLGSMIAPNLASSLCALAVPKASKVTVSLSPGSIAANGATTATATATVTDAGGKPVSGDHVAFTSSDSGDKIGAVTDHGNGTYTAKITSSPVVHQVTITATDSSVSPAVAGRATLSQTAGASVIAVDGSDNSLHVQAPQLSAGWHNLGGTILGAPAVAAVPSSGAYANPLFVAVANDHNLWIRSLTAGWQKLVSGYCLDNPAALVTGSTLYVACEASNHTLWYGKTTLPASGLPHIGGLSSLGGGLSAGPAMATVAGTPTFFISAGNHKLWTRTVSTGWVARTLTCNGHPAAGVAPGGSTTYVACDGAGGALSVMTNSGSGWSSATNYGGAISDGPGLAVTKAGAFFWGVSNGGLWVTHSPSRWTSAGISGVQHGAGAVAVG